MDTAHKADHDRATSRCHKPLQQRAVQRSAAQSITAQHSTAQHLRDGGLGFGT